MILCFLPLLKNSSCRREMLFVMKSAHVFIKAGFVLQYLKAVAVFLFPLCVAHRNEIYIQYYALCGHKYSQISI